VIDARAAAANAAHLAAGLPAWRGFRSALEDPGAAQEAILRRILRENAATAFGREHGFPGLRSATSFRSRVPARTWDELEPWVARAAAGEPGVLTRAPIRLFQPSSGSTAPSKLVPYTAALAAELQRAIGPWLADMALRRPSLLGGPAYWSVSPAGAPERRTAGGGRVGFLDDADYLGPVARRIAPWTLAAPAALRHVADVDTWRRQTLLHLLHARELRLLSCWSPSFLQLLLSQIGAELSGLAREIASGSPPLQAGSRRLPEIEPDKRRAREIERAGAAPARLWPRLALISCWTDGPSAEPAGQLGALAPGLPIEGKGLAATEAIISIPFGGARPLAVCSHFLEFETLNRGLRLAHELREGDVASVMVTTSGGLYRYRLQDRVEVTGFVRRTPTVRFLGKEDHVSDRFGEKIHAGFAEEVITRLRRDLELAPGLAFLAPDEVAGRACYTLFLAAPAPSVPTSAAARLEDLLQESFHYAYCVRLGQLAPARIFLVEGDGLAPFHDACHGRGQRIGDVKPSPLRRDGGWAGALPGRYLSGANR
jgi:hypothetical protein